MVMAIGVFFIESPCFFKGVKAGDINKLQGGRGNPGLGKQGYGTACALDIFKTGRQGVDGFGTGKEFNNGLCDNALGAFWTDEKLSH